MTALLQNFRNTIIASLILAVVMIVGYAKVYAHANGGVLDIVFIQAVFRWMHTLFGVLWIGLLYYFNFVQIRVMPSIPGELKPAISKYIAPEALFWFRWAALATWLMGLILAQSRGYLLAAATLGASEGFQVPGHTFIGVGMWLGTIMFLNVWGVIWPNQKVALGMIDGDAEAKAKAARMAMLFSRINTLLSIPMLVTMTMNQTVFG
jgi:uncharacterized membrane protein